MTVPTISDLFVLIGEKADRIAVLEKALEDVFTSYSQQKAALREIAEWHPCGACAIIARKALGEEWNG